MENQLIGNRNFEMISQDSGLEDEFGNFVRYGWAANQHPRFQTQYQVSERSCEKEHWPRYQQLTQLRRPPLKSYQELLF